MWKFAPVFMEVAAARNPNAAYAPRDGSNPTLYDSRGNQYHFPGLPQHQTIPSNQSSPLTQCIWTFFWLGVLIFVGFPVGFCACELYVLISPFGAICPKFSIITNFFLKVSQFPSLCTKYMIEAKPMISM